MQKTRLRKAVRVLSLRRTHSPRHGVTRYGVVLSRSRPTRLTHTVVKRGRSWFCSCEYFTFTGEVCAHIKAACKKAVA